MIYMRGLKSKDIYYIVDFIYHGEATIYQDDLDSFLALAEELQLKGFMGSKDEKFEKKMHKNSHEKIEQDSNEKKGLKAWKL